jgi:hypothetical protein
MWRAAADHFPGVEQERRSVRQDKKGGVSLAADADLMKVEHSRLPRRQRPPNHRFAGRRTNGRRFRRVQDAR